MGLTPFKCIICFQPPLFYWTEEPSEVPAVDHWFKASERVWDSAHVHLQQAVRRHKDFADSSRSNAPVYHRGVWLSTRDLCLRLPCKKQTPLYIGQFTIQRQINDVTYQLELPARYRIHPAFHVSLLKPFSPSAPGPEAGSTSSRSSERAHHLSSKGDLGLSAMGQPLGIPSRLGGVRARGKILGGLG